MQTQPTSNMLTQFPLQELEQIETIIQKSSQWLTALVGRRDALTAELDRLTRPQTAPPKMASRLIGPGFEYLGQTSTHWAMIDIHVNLLRRLWVDFPDRREEMASAMRSRGTIRTYVAKTVADLFPGKQPAWAQRYSRPLTEGWYVDTNLNRERMRRLLPAAVNASGLKWGTDVKALWYSTMIPRDGAVSVT